MTIHLYTQATRIYTTMNAALRARLRSKFKRYFPYLRLFLDAGHKLTPISTTVFRAVKRDLSDMYPEGDEGIWWAATSTTLTAQVLEDFMGKPGKRTLFTIRCRSAVDISAFSATGTENERLILPGFAYVVVSKADLGNGLTMIQLKEMPQSLGLSFLGPNLRCRPSRSRMHSLMQTAPSGLLI